MFIVASLMSFLYWNKEQHRYILYVHTSFHFLTTSNSYHPFQLKKGVSGEENWWNISIAFVGRFLLTEETLNLFPNFLVSCDLVNFLFKENHALKRFQGHHTLDALDDPMVFPHRFKFTILPTKRSIPPIYFWHDRIRIILKHLFDP